MGGAVFGLRSYSTVPARFAWPRRDPQPQLSDVRGIPSWWPPIFVVTNLLVDLPAFGFVSRAVHLTRAAGWSDARFLHAAPHLAKPGWAGLG